MQTLWQDLRYALRMLAKNPGFTAVAVLTLALGIGANTTIFTLVNAVMLRRLPVSKPQELVLFGPGNFTGMLGGTQPRVWNLFSVPLYQQFRAQQGFFQGVCALSSQASTLRVESGEAGTGGTPQLRVGRLVSGNFFTVLGVKAIAGRMLQPEDDAAGSPRPVTVISYRYWKEYLSQSASAVGRTVELNGALYTIVGVAPPEFFDAKITDRAPDFFLPLGLQPQVTMRASLLNQWDMHWLNVMGRLQAGADPRTAQAALSTRLQQFLTAQGGTNLSADSRHDIAESRIELVPGEAGFSRLRTHFSGPLRILMAAVALVLLIACANIANLLLSRATARQKEISVRLAMGAGRARLLRQLLTESALLAGLGAVAGLLLSEWSAGSFSAVLFGNSTALPLQLSPDRMVLGFTLGVATLTALLFGLAPALSAMRVDLVHALKENANSTSFGGRHGLGRLLVVGQVMLSLSLLVGAGLLVRSLANLQAQDTGFKRDHLLLVEFDALNAGYKPEQLPELYRRLQERANAIPGVRSASISLYALLGGSARMNGLFVPGYAARSEEEMNVQENPVSPQYFETVGMPLVAGRSIGPQDTAKAPRVAVINETMARHFYPGQNAIGKTFSIDDAHKEFIEIVGVARDAKYNNLREKTQALAFVPLAQTTGEDSYASDLEIRTAVEPASVAAELRQAVAGVDSRLILQHVVTMDEQVDESLGGERAIARLTAVFGLLAVLLACIGLYGIMAYAVARRTNEIGIRMALGAQAKHVRWMILRETLVLVGAGLALGIPAAYAASRLIASQLFGLAPGDPLTMGAALLLLAAVGAAAGYLPARRASRVNPLIAIRYN